MLNLPCGGNHLEFAITEKKINFLVFEDFFPVWAFVKTMRRFFLDIRNPPVHLYKSEYPLPKGHPCQVWFNLVRWKKAYFHATRACILFELIYNFPPKKVNISCDKTSHDHSLSKWRFT